jgi:transposase
MPSPSRSNRFCVPSGVPTVEVGRGKIRGLHSMAFYGCWGTGARWRELPQKYPPFQTCHRRFQHWVRAGKLERVLQMLAEELQARGRLDLEEAFIAATFAGAKKGVSAVAPTKRGQGTKILILADGHSLPLAVSIESASPHESQLVEGLLGHSFLDALPARIIGDRAYDSDHSDRDLAERYGIEMIAPHRGARRKPTQDGRPFRRYCRRWRVERLFAWLHHFRRLVIRWEYYVDNFFGMVRLGCMQILLRYV